MCPNRALWFGCVWFSTPKGSCAGGLVSSVAGWRGDGLVLKCQARAKGQEFPAVDQLNREVGLLHTAVQGGGVITYT